MGTVWIDSTNIGSFSPDTQGTEGDVNVDSTDVGDFQLGLTGYVYLSAVEIGTYNAVPSPPTEPEIGDPRYRTKLWLDARLEPGFLTKDDGETKVSFATMFARPNYPLEKEFYADSNPVDLLYCVDTPETTALPVGVGYLDEVPVTIWCINKKGITGTKLRWTAEKELRRIAETYPDGSLRTLSRFSDNEQNLGSTTLYSVTYIMRYKRYS